MEYMHGGDIYTYDHVTDYSVNLNPFGPERPFFWRWKKASGMRRVSGQQQPET